MKITQDLEQPSLIDLEEPNRCVPAFASFEFDVETGLTYWTSELNSLCGFNPEVNLPLDREGMPLALSPADRALIRTRFQAAVESQDASCLNVEVPVVRPGSATRWLQLLGHPFSDHERHRLSGIVLDITERKHIDLCHARVLREQAIFADFSLRIRDVTNIASACDLAVTVLAKSMDVTFTKVLELLPDQKTFLLRAGTGWPAGFVGVARTVVAPGDPAGRALHFRRSAIVNNAHIELDLELRGTTSSFEVTSSVVAVIAMGEQCFGLIGVDTAEAYAFTENELQFLQSLANVLAATIVRIRSEEARQREDRFSVTVLHTSAALITVTDLAGRLVRFNPACEKITGYTAEWVLGRHLSELVPEDEHDELMHCLDLLASGTVREGANRENHWLTREGNRRLISWSDTVLRDSAGQIEYFVNTGLDITERKRLEEEILAISEREQRRIGQDLHDDLGQRLAAIQFLSENLRQEVFEAASPTSELAARISTMAREASDSARMLARGLCPATFDAASLVDALHVLARNTTTLFRIRCGCSTEKLHCIIAPEIAIQLYRIAQEAVCNAVRHSRATEITIEWQLHGRCELCVSDNGVGFAFAEDEREGMGLRSMRYRARLFQGELRIHSRSGHGTQLICEVPSCLCHPVRQN